jgi:hypothetical protein
MGQARIWMDFSRVMLPVRWSNPRSDCASFVLMIILMIIGIGASIPAQSRGKPHFTRVIDHHRRLPGGSPVIRRDRLHNDC